MPRLLGSTTDPEFFTFFRSLESYSRSIGSKTTLFLGPESDYVRYLRDSSPDKAQQ